MNYKDYDEQFLYDLMHEHNREVWVRITLLDNNDNYLSALEGVATGGSINIDGTSAVRRTCSISMVAKDIGTSIDNFYWGLNAKFSVEIGLTAHKKENLKKYLDKDYNPKYTYCIYDINSGAYIEVVTSEEDFNSFRQRGVDLYIKIDSIELDKEIVWFEQGIFLCTGFTTTQGINNYTINLSGKDKMCQLNGELGGTFTATTVLSEYSEDEEVYKPIELTDLTYEYNKYYYNKQEEIDEAKNGLKAVLTDYNKIDMTKEEVTSKSYKKNKFFQKNDSGIYELISKPKWSELNLQPDTKGKYYLYQLPSKKYYYISYEYSKNNENPSYGIIYQPIQNNSDLFTLKPELTSKNYKKNKYYYLDSGKFVLDSGKFVENREYYSWNSDNYVEKSNFKKVSLDDFTTEDYKSIELTEKTYKKNTYYYKGLDDSDFTKSTGKFVLNRIYFEKVRYWDYKKINDLYQEGDSDNNQNTENKNEGIFILSNKKYILVNGSIALSSEKNKIICDLETKKSYYIKKVEYEKASEYKAGLNYYIQEYSKHAVVKKYVKKEKIIEISNSNFSTYMTEENIKNNLIFYYKPKKMYIFGIDPNKSKHYYVKNKYSKKSSLTEKKFLEDDYYLKIENYKQVSDVYEELIKGSKGYYTNQREKVKIDSLNKYDEVISNLSKDNILLCYIQEKFYSSTEKKFSEEEKKGYILYNGWYNAQKEGFPFNPDTDYYKYSCSYSKINKDEVENIFEQFKELKDEEQKKNYTEIFYKSKNSYIKVDYTSDNYDKKKDYYTASLKKVEVKVDQYNDSYDYYVKEEDYILAEKYQKGKTYYYLTPFEKWQYELYENKTDYDLNNIYYLSEIIEQKTVYILDSDGFRKGKKYYEKTLETVVKDLKIEDIVRNLIHIYANEPLENIIINDLDEFGREELIYQNKEEIPMYMFYNTKTLTVETMTLNPKDIVYYLDESGKEKKSTISQIKNYDNLINKELLNNNFDIATRVSRTAKGEKIYTIIKIEKGQVAGYRITDLVYPGKLEMKAGETIIAALDKIKNMLGDFEYFYDIKGKFIFQKKKTYINTSWNNIKYDSEGELYVEDSAYSSSHIFTFEDSNIVTAFQNTPNLLNLKNDYSLWGKRISVDGTPMAIHYRYAIDKKPKYYHSIDFINPGNIYYEKGKLVENQKGQEYSVEKGHDWREIIYQMAQDYYKYSHFLFDFNERVAEANRSQNLYQEGKTGYEIYYVDIKGYWRTIYKPGIEHKKSINPSSGFKDEYQYDASYFTAEKDKSGNIIKYNLFSNVVDTKKASTAGIKYGKKVPSKDKENSEEIEELQLKDSYSYSNIINATKLKVPTEEQFLSLTNSEAISFINFINQFKDSNGNNTIIQGENLYVNYEKDWIINENGGTTGLGESIKVIVQEGLEKNYFTKIEANVKTNTLEYLADKYGVTRVAEAKQFFEKYILEENKNYNIEYKGKILNNIKIDSNFEQIIEDALAKEIIVITMLTLKVAKAEDFDDKIKDWKKILKKYDLELKKGDSFLVDYNQNLINNIKAEDTVEIVNDNLAKNYFILSNECYEDNEDYNYLVRTIKTTYNALKEKEDGAIPFSYFIPVSLGSSLTEEEFYYYFIDDRNELIYTTDWNFITQDTEGNWIPKEGYREKLLYLWKEQKIEKNTEEEKKEEIKLILTNKINKDKLKELVSSGKYDIFKRKKVIFSEELPPGEAVKKVNPLNYGLTQLTETQEKRFSREWTHIVFNGTNLKAIYYYEQYSYCSTGKDWGYEKIDTVNWEQGKYFSHYFKITPYNLYWDENEYIALYRAGNGNYSAYEIHNIEDYNIAIANGVVLCYTKYDDIYCPIEDELSLQCLKTYSKEIYVRNKIEEKICSSLDKEKYFSNYLKMTIYDPYWEENEYIALHRNEDGTYYKVRIQDEEDYKYAVEHEQEIVLRYSGKDVYYPVEDEFSLQCLKIFEKELYEEKEVINYFYIKDNSFTPFETLEELKNYCFNEKNYVIYIKNINNNNLMSLEEESVSYNVSNSDFKCETSTINYTTMSYKIDYTQVKIRNKDSVKARWNVKEIEKLEYNSGTQYRSHYKVVSSGEQYNKDLKYIAIKKGENDYDVKTINEEEEFKEILQSAENIVMNRDGNNYHNIWNKSQFMCFKLNKKEGNIENDNIEAYELVDPKEGLNIPSYEAGTYYLKESNKYMLIDSEIEFNNILNNTNIYEIYKKSIEVKATAKSVEQADSYTFLKGKNYYKANSNSNNWSLVSPSTQYQFTSEAKKEKTLYLLEEDSDANFSPITGWNFDVTENPAALDFWIDFMDVEGEMGKYQVSAIGDRIKNTNDDKITAIYFNNIPNVIFATKEEIASLDFRSKYRLTSGYSYIQVDDDLMNCFSISGRGKSAKEELDNLLYSHSYCAETITLTTLPVYHLQPNTRILVRNDETKINGEYIINRMTLPLNYNGTSSITAVKAVERLY